MYIKRETYAVYIKISFLKTLNPRLYPLKP